MSKNIEVKAYCPDLNRAKKICASLGAHIKRDHWQTDTYFAISQDRLKFRESNKFPSCLIYYRRADDPSLRESSYIKIDLPDDVTGLRDLLSSAIGTRIIVEKHRETYALSSALINLDTIAELGSFVEIEVDVEEAGADKALIYANRLKNALQIAEGDIVPWSYSELFAAYQNASKWKDRLAKSGDLGRLFLIDGPSGSGKSTIAMRLRQNRALELRFARRHCTRPRRAQEEDEYIFISNKKFTAMVKAGQFLECRNFEFGMSYGLSWQEALQPIVNGKDVLAVVNWGNARHIKRIFSDAILILATAPRSTLRRRLLARGIHNPDHLAERLTNAERFSHDDQVYDLVVSNEDGKLDSVVRKIAGFISGGAATKRRNAQGSTGT